MSSLLRKQLLRSDSHYSREIAALLTQDLEDEHSGSEWQQEARDEEEAAPPSPAAQRTSAESTDLTEPLAPKERRIGTTWKATAAVLLADMFGLGTLTLPADFARLGWALALGVTLASACGLLFSGLLFTRLGQLVPRAQTFADFGDAAMGRAGRRLVHACVYSCIALEPVILALICTENLRQVLAPLGVSQLMCGVIIAAFMLPLSQIQTLDEITWLAYAGTIGMLGGVAIVFGKLVALPAPDIPHSLVPVATKNPRAAVTATLDIVFTYGGQVNWVRYLAGMKRKADFKRASNFAGAFMTVIYVALGLYGYSVLGDNFDFEQPVTSIFKNDAWVIVMNAGILVHCIIAYQINLNVWTDMVLHLFVDDLNTPEVLFLSSCLLVYLYARLTQRWRKHPDDEPRPCCTALNTSTHARTHARIEHTNFVSAGLQERSSPRGRRIWAVVTTAGIVYALAVSQSVPYFSLVMAIIAAVGDLTAAYALPALFCLKLSGPRLPLPRWQAAGCYALIPTAVALSGLGLASSLADLVGKLVHRS